MSLPRDVIPASTYLVTRRTEGGRFWLRPDGTVDQVVTYLLGVYTRRHGIEISGFVVMGNHIHIVLCDPRGELPLFAHGFFGTLARALNHHHRRRGRFWDGEGYSRVLLDTADDVIGKLAYTIANPTAAGLVRSPKDYPGLIVLPEEIGVRELTAERPAKFFRQPEEPEPGADDLHEETARERNRRLRGDKAKEDEGDGRCMPDRATLRIVVPRLLGLPTLAPKVPADRGVLSRRLWRPLRERVDEALVKARAARRKSGKTGWLGADGVRAQNPRHAPDEEATRLPDGSLNPRFAPGPSRWKKIELGQAQKAFWQAHALALIAFNGGTRDVEFPPGTWKMVKVHGARAPACSAAA